MTIHKVICSHHDLLQALPGIRSNANLQAQQDIPSYENMYHVEIVSLESLRIAHESYALLRPLVEVWSCSPDLDLLSLVACLSLELHKVEHDLLPSLQDQESKLEGRVVQALIYMKNSGITLLRMGKSVEKELKSSLEDSVVSDRVKEVGMMLVDIADQVLKGTHNIVWLKERVPLLVELVSALMATPLFFASP